MVMVSFWNRMATEHMLFHHTTAVEYEAVEAEKARAIGLHDSEVINSDFHRFCLDTEQRFNLVVGNPPLSAINIMMKNSRCWQARYLRKQV